MFWTWRQLVDLKAKQRDSITLQSVFENYDPKTVAERDYEIIRVVSRFFAFKKQEIAFLKRVLNE